MKVYSLPVIGSTEQLYSSKYVFTYFAAQFLSETS